MKMLTVTRVAALAVGLSLVAGQAFAADDDNNRGRRHNNDNTASDQQDPNDQGDRDRRGQRKQAPPATVAPAPVVAPVVQPAPTGRWQDRNRRGANDDRRGYNDQANDRDNNYRNARDNRRDWNDNDRRNWGKQDRRRFDVRQYRRNFNAQRRFRANPYNWYAGYSYQRYGYGQRLPRHFFARNFWLSNFYYYGLFAPPPGYVWVRYGPDALLIDIETGEIVQVQYDMFYS
jgi:Ni/Co efflux regulator RcnB